MKEALAAAGIPQSRLANHLHLARSTVCAICNQNRYPVGREDEIRRDIGLFLKQNNVEADLQVQTPDVETDSSEDEEIQARSNEMLTNAARKHFSLFKDPFTDDVRSAEDVYQNSNVRFVAEYMYQAAKLSSLIAVVGESGSGKTTLRKMLIDRINASSEKIKIIFPRTLDRTRLTVGAICDAIIRDVSTETPKRTLEAKSNQVERVLAASARNGYSHVLMIEEAHDLSIQTLKYLKRFWELEDGFSRLMGIVLVAQPELKIKLDESRNWEAREIIRRLEVVELEPFMEASELKEYLDKKLRKAGSCADAVFSDDAYGAILEAFTRRLKSGQYTRFCYPLSVNNLAKRAMNEAAAIAEPLVTAEIINAVR